MMANDLSIVKSTEKKRTIAFLDSLEQSKLMEWVVVVVVYTHHQISYRHRADQSEKTNKATTTTTKRIKLKLVLQAAAAASTRSCCNILVAFTAIGNGGTHATTKAK